MSTPTARRLRRQRHFTITFGIEGTDYKLHPLPIDPSIGMVAVRFVKQGGDGEVYDLHRDGFGWNCQCKGFLAHGHCKHVETVRAAARIFGVNLAPVAEADPWDGAALAESA
jgi:hypothetical protein